MSTPHGEQRALVALVTGAAAGIGEAIAARLARDGMTVLVADLDMAAAAEVARRLVSAGLRAAPLALDVGNAASIAAAFDRVDTEHGGCDVLVNNAGIAKIVPFMDLQADLWARTLDVNLTGALLCTQHAARMMMRNRWGRIVNIASISGIRAGSGRTAYGTSKAALIGLTRQMAVELAAHGITANAVAPGPVDTPMALAAHTERMRKQYTSTIPMGRYGTPEEIAAAAAFLASRESSYITGQVLAVDGGYVAAGQLEI